MAKYANVKLKDEDERKDLQKFCKDYFNRSFSAQCRYMLIKAKREADQEAKSE